MLAWSPTVVYLLSFLTSALCSFLLARSYVQTRTRLLLWSALCFLFLAFNNLVVVVDMLLIPQISFSVLRVALSLAGVSLLLFGLIWDGDDEK